MHHVVSSVKHFKENYADYKNKYNKTPSHGDLWTTRCRQIDICG